MVLQSVLVDLVEVRGSEVLVVSLLGEHVPDGLEHRVRNGDDRPFWAAPGLQSAKEGAVVAALGSGRGPRCFDEGRFQPVAALADMTVAVFSTAFVVAGADAGPRGQVGGTWKARHVVPNLGEQSLCCSLPDSGHRPHGGRGFSERVHALRDMLVERF